MRAFGDFVIGASRFVVALIVIFLTVLGEPLPDRLIGFAVYLALYPAWPITFREFRTVQDNVEKLSRGSPR